MALPQKDVSKTNNFLLKVMSILLTIIFTLIGLVYTSTIASQKEFNDRIQNRVDSNESDITTQKVNEAATAQVLNSIDKRLGNIEGYFGIKPKQ